VVARMGSHGYVAAPAARSGLARASPETAVGTTSANPTAVQQCCAGPRVLCLPSTTARGTRGWADASILGSASVGRGHARVLARVLLAVDWRHSTVPARSAKTSHAGSEMVC
jgi:hypothetical protein